MASSSLLLAACGSQGGSQVDVGESVEAGSESAAYAEALQDFEGVSLEWGGHSSAPPAKAPAASKAYTDLVTEMSGGKLEFVHDWGGAKVSGPEVARAMDQGRVDMGIYIPTYAPDEWPVSDMFSRISSVERSDALAARLAMLAARVEFSHTWEPLVAEHERHGIHPVFPLFSPSSAIQLICTDEAAPTSEADLAGKRVRVSSTSHEQMAKALGMVPVSLPTTELFNAFQRGVVDCATAGISGNVSLGINEAASSWVSATESGVNWTESPISWGLSQRTMDQLPLAAQQLLWDTQKQNLELQIVAQNEAYVEAVVDARERGYGFGEYDEQVSAAMADYLASEREAVAEAMESAGIADDGAQVVADYEALYAKWLAIVTDELGYPEGVNWPDLPGYVEENGEIDFGPFAERVYQEVLLERRPG